MKDMGVMPNEKSKDKPIGCRIEVLDDGTFLLTLENENYGMNKEYSFDNLDDVFQEIEDYLPEETNHRDQMDENPKSKSGREMAAKITQGE